MKCRSALAVVFLLVSCESASACGGSEAGFATRQFKSGACFASTGRVINPIAQNSARQQAQFARAKQVLAARAAAYHARMQPIRAANANRVRQAKLAQREARKEIRLAKLEAQRQQERIFLAQARTWTDTTGNHQVVAVLADANAWGVKLRTQDGSTMNVPMQRLSTQDQTVVAAIIAGGLDNGVMLAGL